MSQECENCFFTDQNTGACTNDDDCEDNSAFVKNLDPEDMFKLFYMLLFASNGEMAIPVESLDKITDDMYLTTGYDAENKRYTVKTSVTPVQPKAPKRMRTIVQRSSKLVLPEGMN